MYLIYIYIYIQKNTFCRLLAFGMAKNLRFSIYSKLTTFLVNNKVIRQFECAVQL